MNSGCAVGNHDVMKESLFFTALSMKRALRKRNPATLLRAATAAPPSVQEWDFTDCPKDELSYCCYYEYARESERIRELVNTLRASTVDPDISLYPGDLIYYETQWFKTFFRQLHEFPATPWLKINPNKRRTVWQFCQRWEEPFFSIEPLRLNKPN